MFCTGRDSGRPDRLAVIFMTDGRCRATVPRKREIKKGTLMSIIRQSEMGKEIFLK